MSGTLGDLTGPVSLGRRRLSSLFVVFVNSNVGVTECAAFWPRQADDVAAAEG